MVRVGIVPALVPSMVIPQRVGGIMCRIAPVRLRVSLAGVGGVPGRRGERRPGSLRSGYSMVIVTSVFQVMST